MTLDPAIIEAAARVLRANSFTYMPLEEAEDISAAILAAVTPLIRSDALEQAAQSIEGGEGWFSRVGVPARVNLATAIRALKEQP